MTEIRPICASPVDRQAYREFYEELARDHGDMDDQYYGPGGTSGGWGDRLLDHVMARLPDCKGCFADIGSADGRLLLKLADRMPMRIGVELSGVRLRRARRKLASEGRPVLLVQSFLESMPLETASIDVATCLETLEHVLDVPQALNELRRILQTGGHLFVSVPSVTLRTYWEMYRLRRPLYCDEREHLREFSAQDIPWFTHKFVRTDELESWFQAARFRVVQRSGVGYLFPRWADAIPAIRALFDMVYGRMNGLCGYLPYIRQFPKHTVYHLVAA